MLLATPWLLRLFSRRKDGTKTKETLRAVFLETSGGWLIDEFIYLNDNIFNKILLHIVILVKKLTL